MSSTRPPPRTRGSTHPVAACRRLVLSLVHQVVEVGDEVAVERAIAAPPADVRPTPTLARDLVAVVVESAADVTVARLTAVNLARLQAPVLILATQTTDGGWWWTESRPVLSAVYKLKYMHTLNSIHVQLCTREHVAICRHGKYDDKPRPHTSGCELMSTLKQHG